MKSLNIKGIKNTTLVLALGVLLAAGATFAWSSTWHAPESWIGDGQTIQADKMGESLQYLYDEISDLKDRVAAVESGTDGADGGTSDPGVWVGHKYVPNGVTISCDPGYFSHSVTAYARTFDQKLQTRIVYGSYADTGWVDGSVAVLSQYHFDAKQYGGKLVFTYTRPPIPDEDIAIGMVQPPVTCTASWPD